MFYNFDSKSIPTTKNGFLKRRQDWSKDLAKAIAKTEGITLTERHWDIINFLRTEYYANSGIIPMQRDIEKYTEQVWRSKLSRKELYQLFPGTPIKQGVKIAGLPEPVC